MNIIENKIHWVLCPIVFLVLIEGCEILNREEASLVYITRHLTDARNTKAFLCREVTLCTLMSYAHCHGGNCERFIRPGATELKFSRPRDVFIKFKRILSRMDFQEKMEKCLTEKHITRLQDLRNDCMCGHLWD